MTSCFHATAESEAEDIRRLGFTQPICVLPNGVDVPPLEKIHGGQRRQLLFLGRLHPKKGVDVLFRAWSAIQDRLRDWELLVAGPDECGYLARLKALADALKLERVVFCGPLYGKDKLHAYRSAELFVLPTHSENFGLTVAESLAAGTPAIVTVGAPWQGLRREGAGWWVDIGIDPLVACLEEALASSSEHLAQMGVAGRQWMLRDYSWRRIGEQSAVTYRWLLEGGDSPSWVTLN